LAGVTPFQNDAGSKTLSQLPAGPPLRRRQVFQRVSPVNGCHGRQRVCQRHAWAAGMIDMGGLTIDL